MVKMAKPGVIHPANSIARAVSYLSTSKFSIRTYSLGHEVTFPLESPEKLATFRDPIDKTLIHNSK